MEFRFALFAAALTALPAAVHADSAAGITLPLSHYGSLLPPRLKTSGLASPARKEVEDAIATARRATEAALAAENMVQAAMKAEGDAAGTRPGPRLLDRPPHCRYQGETIRGHATGLGVMRCEAHIFAGRFRDGRLDGLGGDYSLNAVDAYEGTYRDGARAGFGVERDKDGFYPGFYGIGQDGKGHKVNMELLGLQDFKTAAWAGHYGFYSGPKIACSLIKGAVLEGSVLDGAGAKFNGQGELTEQGVYHLGRLQGGSGPPC